MQKSDSIQNLAKALCAAQGEMKPAAFNATNPFLKNKYADLGAIIETAQPVLRKYGLSYCQPVSGNGEAITLTTLLMHESGEWIEETVSLPLNEEKGKSQAQAAGSVITYLRRYSLASMLGVYADEDTDGNEPERKPAQAQRPAPVNGKPAAEQVEPEHEDAPPAVQPANGNKPTQALLDRWSKLVQEAQGIGIKVAPIVPGKITADELIERGKDLRDQIETAKATAAA